VHIHDLLNKRLAIVTILLSCFNLVGAQTPSPTPSSTPIKLHNVSKPAEPPPNMDLSCAGYIEYKPYQIRMEVIGGEQEQEQQIFSQGNHIFINAGAQHGLQVGQEFAVVRPRGKFSSKLSKKRGQLGVYIQEIGRIRVKDVKQQVSVAEVLDSCDLIMMGDLLKPWRARTVPSIRPLRKLNRFLDPNGKQTGRIVMARSAREMVTKNDLVFIDLGRQDGLKKGDYLTIYRPGGTGNITEFEDIYVGTPASEGFGSDEFKGGNYSLHAPRTKKMESSSRGPVETRPDVKRKRPAIPRKVLGEMVILEVQERTASAIVTQADMEVHNGDYVELQ
jgi:hypothetical protein